jgi:hypothetical protein
MKEFMAKLAITTAIVAGSAMVAQACPQTTAMGKDNTAKLQLAQAGGGGTGAGGGGGTSAGGTANPSNTATGAPGGTTPGQETGEKGGGSARPVIPPEEPMRQPGTPQTPGTQTSPK